MKSKVDMLGRTMWETIAAISVIGLISVGIIKMASTVMERYKLSRIGQQVTDLQKAISFRYMSKGKYNNISLDQLEADNALPYEFKNKVNAFGGAIEIGGIVIDQKLEDAEIYGDNLLVARRYYIKFDGLPLEACTSLSDISWVNDGASSLVATYLGRGCELREVSNKQELDRYAPNPSADSQTCVFSYSTPIEIDKVATGCSEKKSSIIWIFE